MHMCPGSTSGDERACFFLRYVTGHYSSVELLPLLLCAPAAGVGRRGAPGFSSRRSSCCFNGADDAVLFLSTVASPALLGIGLPAAALALPLVHQPAHAGHPLLPSLVRTRRCDAAARANNGWRQITKFTNPVSGIVTATTRPKLSMPAVLPCACLYKK